MSPGLGGEMASERQHRLAIVEFGRLLHGNGFVAATDGNLSVRLDERRLLVTPTYMSKGRMRPSDIVIADMDGNRLAGTRNVSSEIGISLPMWRSRHSGNSGGAGAAGSLARCDLDGQSRSRDLWLHPRKRLHEDGNRRTLRPHCAGDSHPGPRAAARRERC